MNTLSGISVNIVKVDFFSFSYAPSDLKEKWRIEIQKVIDSGTLIGGEHLESFESAFAKFTKSEIAIGVSNGLDGITLALRGLGIGAGDIVAVPAHTFIATWTAVLAVGAKPVGVDVDEDGLIDLEKLGEIKERIKAVIPVHMHGAPVNMLALNNLCKEIQKSDEIFLIEDASQAHGALNKDGTNLGTYSHAVVYSLYPTKNLGALGDAGIITTNDRSLGKKIRTMANYGSRQRNKYIHEIIGFNNRLDPIQASVLEANLQLLPTWNSARKYLSDFYISELANSIEILQETRGDSVRHHFCILHKDRDELLHYLRERGIGTDIHYPRLAANEIEMLTGQDKKNYPVAERITNSTLSLPISQWHSEMQISYVVSQMLTWLKA